MEEAHFLTMWAAPIPGLGSPEFRVRKSMEKSGLEAWGEVEAAVPGSLVSRGQGGRGLGSKRAGGTVLGYSLTGV